ncbi:MAG TPA: HDOD domain-containing protein [Desulfobacterales bacterium]|nr:HDOD domain-containing protein [Desulfobacterales bacterium]HIP39760.1 HDOD domain-containing protein [Desulfocapsa sulfexigens]
MNHRHISRILKQVDSLPPLPATVSRVLAITADPESSADDLVNGILPDQAMCATILKFANSAFFGIPRNVATMNKAVNVLGFNEVHNIVLGKAVFNSFQIIGRENKKTINGFWNHSFSCGLSAKILAKDLRYSQSELFIGGLIHDIGKLILLIALPDIYRPILERETDDQVQHRQAETDTFGIDHCQVGFKILNRWLFPERLLASVAYHHQPDQCPEEHKVYPTIIEISDALSHLLSMKEEHEAESLLSQFSSLLPDRAALWQEHNLKIDEEQLQSWMKTLETSLEEDSGIRQTLSS